MELKIKIAINIIRKLIKHLQQLIRIYLYHLNETDLSELGMSVTVSRKHQDWLTLYGVHSLEMDPNKIEIKLHFATETNHVFTK